MAIKRETDTKNSEKESSLANERQAARQGEKKQKKNILLSFYLYKSGGKFCAGFGNNASDRAFCFKEKERRNVEFSPLFPGYKRK